MPGARTYVGILVVIAAAMFALFLTLSHGPVQAPAATTSISNSTTTSVMYNASTTMAQNQTYACESSNSIVPIYGGNFSSGTFFGWNVIGTGFGKAPINFSLANEKGDYYLVPWSGNSYGNAFGAASYAPNFAPSPGTLSLTYVPVLPYLNFQIYSPASRNLYIKITPSRGIGFSIYYDTLNGSYTNTTNRLAYASINMTKLMCQSIKVSVVSNVTPTQSSAGTVFSNQNLYVAVTGFYQASQPYETGGIVINVT